MEGLPRPAGLFRRRSTKAIPIVCPARDLPVAEQSDWFSGHGYGFGVSCIIRQDVSQLLGDKFWISLGISMSALFMAYLIAVPVGIISATSKSAIVNHSLRLISYLAQVGTSLTRWYG